MHRALADVAAYFDDIVSAHAPGEAARATKALALLRTLYDGAIELSSLRG